MEEVVRIAEPNAWRVWMGIRVFIEMFKIGELSELLRVFDDVVRHVHPVYSGYAGHFGEAGGKYLEAERLINEHGGLDVWLLVLNSVEGVKYFDMYLQSRRRVLSCVKLESFG
jgi:hypothetical protein